MEYWLNNSKPYLLTGPVNKTLKPRLLSKNNYVIVKLITAGTGKKIFCEVRW